LRDQRARGKRRKFDFFFSSDIIVDVSTLYCFSENCEVGARVLDEMVHEVL